MTRREKHMTMLDLTEEYLMGEGELSAEELLHGVRWALGRAEAPPWLAEVVFRAERREYREEQLAKGER